MTLVIELPPEEEAVLKEQAAAEGLSVEDYALRVLKEKGAVEEVPIWEAIAENMRAVPDEQLRDLPSDGAEQADHYLYGHPK